MARYDKHVAEGLVHGTTALSDLGGGGGSLDGIDDQSSSNDDQITIKDTEVVINEDQDDLDFRVESDTNTHMLFVDGGNERVGIGGSPSTTLHVKATDPRIRAEATAGDHPGFELSEDGSRKWVIYNEPDGSADSLNFKSSADRFKITPSAEVRSEGPLKIKEAAAAVADTAAYGQLWIKTATPNELYFTTDAGDDIQLTSGATQIADGRKTIVSIEEATDLSSVSAAVAYSGAVFSIEQSDSGAYAITLPTATSTAEAAAIIGWHISVVLTGAEAENVTIVRGDASNDFIQGTVVAGDAAASGITIGSHVITFVGDVATVGDRADITCLSADASNTIFVVQGFCAV